MSTGGTAPRPSKNERRDAAREKARALREEQRKRERRNKILVGGGITLGALAIIAIIAVIIFTSIRPAGPGPRNMATDGIKIGEGFVAEEAAALQPGEEPSEPSVNPANVVDIRIWVDFLCPVCGAFEAANADQIEGWLEDGSVTYEVHPISFLDRVSQGTKYSTRAANAAACVADYSPDSFLAYSDALFANQPEENSTGLDNETLAALAGDAGVENASQIEQCIDEGEFTDWVGDATLRAQAGPIPNSNVESITGTPTVIVNGEQYTGSVSDPDEFAAFVLAQSATPSTTATPTPTPTPTP